jgi:hypothetical protein
MIQQTLTHASFYKSLIPDSNFPEEPNKGSLGSKPEIVALPRFYAMALPRIGGHHSSSVPPQFVQRIRTLI